MSALKLAWLSFIRRGFGLVPLIIFTTVLFSLVTLLVALEGTLRAMGNPSLDDRTLRVGAMGKPFTQAEIDRVARIPGVQEVAPVAKSACVDAHGQKFPCWGVNDVFTRLSAYNLNVPKEGLERWNQERNGVLCGRAAATDNNWKVGDAVTLNLASGQALNAKISYISDEGLKPQLVWLHNDFVNAATKANTYEPIFVVSDTPQKQREVLEAAEKLFGELNHRVTVITQREAKRGLLGFSEIFLLLFRGAGILSILLVAFVALTILVLMIDNRRRELATLRAIGCRRSLLGKLILVESVLLLVPGALLGSALVWWRFHEKGLPMSANIFIQVPLLDIALVTGIGIALALLAGFVPARRAQNTNVLMTLRGE
jgi:ABC-type lipoprotein release transport system permease subunit